MDFDFFKFIFQIVYQQKIDRKAHLNDLNWDKINLNYLSSNKFYKIGFLPKELNGQQAIEFTFLTKKGIEPHLNLQNIILQATSNKTIDINSPVRDSTYYLNDGSLSWTIVHYLNKSELNFIKEEIIKEIIINVDNEPLRIRLAKKSRTLFRENF